MSITETQSKNILLERVKKCFMKLNIFQPTLIGYYGGDRS